LSWQKKIGEKFNFKPIKFFIIKNTVYLSGKDVQATEEAFRPQKGTSSTSKHEIS
jgi:hypothetical protein